MVGDGGSAEEQLRGDLRVGGALAGQAGDQRFLRGQGIWRLDGVLPGVPAGRPQLDAGPFGKRRGADGVEDLVRAAELIAGITRQVMQDYSVDPRRVYVGGLSAGAAAAAVMGATYPDLYAAIAVHSGLPCGAADDLISAFAAMRQGDSRNSSAFGDTSVVPEDRSPVPTIVFHGDRDTIVNKRNGDRFAEEFSTPAYAKRVEERRAPGGRAYTQKVYADAGGRSVFEQWTIHGAGHAWSGGSVAGS